MLKKIKDNLYQLLRRSESYTKTDMVYLASGGAWLTVGRVVSAGATFLLSIAFANLLPKETYGVYKYVLSFASLLAIPTLQEMGTAIVQAVASGKEGSVVPALKARIRWGLLGGMAGLAFAGYYYLNGNDTLTIAFLIVAVFIPFMDSFDIYDHFFQGKKWFNRSAKYQMISKIIASGVLIASLFFTSNVFLILLAYFVPWTVLRSIITLITIKKFIPRKKEDPSAVSYGKQLSLMSVIITVANYLDRLLVFHFLGPGSVAVYSFAIAPPEQIKKTLSSLNLLALPKFVQRDTEEIKRGMKGKFIRLFILSALAVSAYIITAPFIFNIFFPQYSDSIFLSQLFALSMLNTTFFPAGTFLKAKRKIKEQYLANSIASVFQIIIMTVFIILWGLIGLILARIASRFVATLTKVYFYYRTTE